MNPTYTIFQIVRLLWARLNHRGIVEVLVNDYPETLQEILRQYPGLIRPAKDVPMSPWMLEALAALRGNNKVAAIKAHRAATGIGLLESKQMIDEIYTNIYPDFSHHRPGSEAAAAHRKLVDSLPKAFREAARAAYKAQQ